MSRGYSCGVCGTYEIISKEWPGSGSTATNCRACDEFLARSPGTLSASRDTRDLRNRVALVFIYRNRALEALNFCLSLLSRESPACSSHPNYSPDLAFRDLTRFKKSDLDPESPPPINLQPHPHTELLYTLTLATFATFGPSVFAISCLRRAYHTNPYILRVLSKSKSERTGPDHGMGEKGQQAMIYLICEQVWNVPGMSEWLKDSEEEVKKRACDAVDCGKVEERVGEWKLCKGCREWWDCGTECQTKDWKQGGHRKICKESKLALMRARGMEDAYLSLQERLEFPYGRRTE